MRILMVHPGVDFSVADMHNGWVEAFRALGVTVVEFNLHHRIAVMAASGHLTEAGQFVQPWTPAQASQLVAEQLEGVCFAFWPDVVFVTSGFYVGHDTLDLIRDRAMRVVALMSEQPYESDRELALAAHADLVLLNDPTNIDRFRRIAPALYAPHAYRPAVHHPGPGRPDLAADFCFIGTGFPSRVAFFEQVDWLGVDVALGGMWQTLTDDSPLRSFVGHGLDRCMDNAETADAYRSARIGANLYRTEGDGSVTAGWSLGPREVEMAACGLPFARQSRGEGDGVLAMLPRFREPGELGDLIRWHLAHPDICADLADRARAAIADRTFEANATTLLRHLDR